MLGAFFQCYKQPTATFHALQNFRNAYPNETIILLSDNGYNYTKMAEHFNALYFHERENVGVSLGPGCPAKIEDFKKFIKRLQNVLPLIKEEYFMMLEDDVFTKAPYTEEFKGTINGNCINYIRSNVFKQIPFYTGPVVDRLYSGHGGCVYNKNELLHAISNEELIDWLIHNWLVMGLGPRLDCDIFLSIVVYVNNLNIHKLSQHKDGMIYINSANVIHQYKRWYGVPLPDNLAHLVTE